MDLIAILGGNINGVDGDELVLEEDEDFEVHYEGEEGTLEDVLFEDISDEGDVHD